MEYDGLRYIKIYSTGASASSLGIPLPRWGVDCICAIFYNIGSRMDPNLKQRIIEEGKILLSGRDITISWSQL